MKGVVIVGSSRANGNTEQVARRLAAEAGWDLINISELTMSFYDYEHRNRTDDFLPTLRQLSENYELWVFATPVYWYAMSGQMKLFFDRLTDLLTIEKDLGRTLRGKSMAVVTSSNGGNLGEDFWLPFKASATYLGMKYLGDLHTLAEQVELEELTQFINRIKNT